MISILQNRTAGYVSAMLGIAAVTIIAAPFHDQLNNTTVALALVLVVLFVATMWGRGPGMLASLLGMLCFNFFFLPPLYTFTIADPQNWIALTAFVVTASIAGHLSVTAKRRAAEAEAERKAAKLASAYNRSLIEASLDPLVTIGPDGKITDVNAATEAATGRSRAELIGTDFSDYFTESEKAKAGYQQAFREGFVRDYALELRHRDGHITSVLYNASVYRDDSGKVTGLFAAARDITERKRTEAELRESERRMRLIIDTALDAVIAINSQGEITEWNPQAELIFGWSHEEAIGRTLADLIIPLQYRDAHARGLKQFLATGEGSLLNRRIEVTALRRDGHEVPIELSISPAKKGEAYTFSAFVSDITERKRAENEIRLLARLQAVVAELGQRALHSDRYENVLDEAVTLVAQVLDVDYCNVMELLPGGEELLLRAGVGWKEGYLGQAKVKSRDSQSGYTIRSDRPVIVDDAATETRFVPLPLLFGESVVSSMSVVISTSEGPYGALGVHTRHRRTFTEDEVNFLQAVANVLGSAIERQRAEAQLRRINQTQRALSKCNEALIRSTDESTLLQQICDIVVEEAAYRFCWVGRAEHDEAKSVRPVARSGFEAGYLDNLNITWADTERGQGPTGTCIRTRQTVVAKDIATDPKMIPWRAEALKRGYASSVAIPLLVDSAVFGALMIYAAEPDAFGPEEVSLLTELASDLAFGIAALRTEDRTRTGRGGNPHAQCRVGAARYGPNRRASSREQSQG